MVIIVKDLEKYACHHLHFNKDSTSKLTYLFLKTEIYLYISKAGKQKSFFLGAV